MKQLNEKRPSATVASNLDLKSPSHQSSLNNQVDLFDSNQGRSRATTMSKKGDRPNNLAFGRIQR